MLAIIYRAWIHPEKESLYQQLWNNISEYFIKERGALGSCLHQSEEGYWVIYSRWPDKLTWKASWPTDDKLAPESLPDSIKAHITTIKECVDNSRKFPEIIMEVRHDALLNLDQNE